MIAGASPARGEEAGDAKTAAPAATAAVTQKKPAGATVAAKPELIQSQMPAWLEVGVQGRGRLELPSGIAYVPDTSDVYYLSRLRFDLGVKVRPWLRFSSQIQDSRTVNYDLGPAPTNMRDPLDLRQAYADIGVAEGEGFRMRFGRQEIKLGQGRLMGASDWGNVARSWDAARLSYTRAGMKADLLAGSVVLADPSRFDRHRPGEHLYGAYLGFDKLVKRATIEPYLFAKTQLKVAGERGEIGNSHLYTGGFRVFGKLPGRFDYNAEMARQWGYYASDGIAAWAGTYTAGWTAVTTWWKPRLSADVHLASGDDALKDGSRGTFDQLYPSNHDFMGTGDQVGWRNLRSYKGGVEVSPTRKFKAMVDYRELYLASVQDGFYNSGGTRMVLNRKAGSAHIGSELDIVTVYLLPQGVSLGIGVAHLFPGEYLKQSTKGHGYTYPYIMWAKRF
jgi:hypothetical protein